MARGTGGRRTQPFDLPEAMSRLEDTSEGDALARPHWRRGCSRGGRPPGSAAFAERPRPARIGPLADLPELRSVDSLRWKRPGRAIRCSRDPGARTEGGLKAQEAAPRLTL